MKDLEVGDMVNVRGMNTVHEVVSVIGRTRQVHVRCVVTGTVLEYIDVSAVSIVPVFTKTAKKEINGIELGDTVVPLVNAGATTQEYTVVGINLSKGTYDLCNNTTKKVVKDVSNRHVTKHTEVEQVKTIKNGDRVVLKGYDAVFTVVNTHVDDDDERMVDILQLINIAHTDGSYTHYNRIDYISIDAVEHVKAA